MSKQIYLPTDAAAGTGSLRTLGTGAQQAAVGSHSHAHSAITGIGTDDHHAQLHAASHDPGGTDTLHDLTRLDAGPAVNALTAWSYDPMVAPNGVTPAAGWIYLTKIMTAHTYTVSTLAYFIRSAGTGATALANCYLGIYDSSGTRRFLSADQSSVWNSQGDKALSLGGSAYTVAANDYIYIALLVGTQSSNSVQLAGLTHGLAGVPNLGLSGANLRFCTHGAGGFSALPSSTTPASYAAASSTYLFGVK